MNKNICLCLLLALVIFLPSCYETQYVTHYAPRQEKVLLKTETIISGTDTIQVPQYAYKEVVDTVTTKEKCLKLSSWWFCLIPPHFIPAIIVGILSSNSETCE